MVGLVDVICEQRHIEEESKDENITVRPEPLTPKTNTDYLYVYVGIGVGLSVIAIITLTAVLILKRKKKLCFKQNAKSKVDQELKIHKNDLYGNLSNLD